MKINMPLMTPFTWQRDAIRGIQKANRSVLLVSRQSGKTALLVNVIMDFIFTYTKKRNPRMMIAATTNQQAYDVLFSRIWEYLEKVPGRLMTKSGGGNTPIRIVIRRPWIGDHVTCVMTGTGNPKALRGNTNDLLVIDEAAFIDEEVFHTALEPTTAATKGKIILTTTINGTNWFWDLFKTYSKRMEEGDDYYYALRLPMDKVGIFSDEEVARKEADAISSNKGHLFRQEYMCDPMAMPDEVAPFINKIREARRNGQLKSNIAVNPNLINISIDIGTNQNMAMWAWVRDRHEDKIYILDYIDNATSLFDVPEILFKRYNIYRKINIIFPVDINQPSIELGGTREQNLRDYLRKRGFHRKIRIQSLPKIVKKEPIIAEGIALFKKCVFDEPNCRRGLYKLSGAQFKQDVKTKYVDFGKWVRNGNDHAADAFIYIAAALYENRIVKDDHFDRDMFEKVQRADYRERNPLNVDYLSNNKFDKEYF